MVRYELSFFSWKEKGHFTYFDADVPKAMFLLKMLLFIKIFVKISSNGISLSIEFYGHISDEYKIDWNLVSLSMTTQFSAKSNEHKSIFKEQLQILNY